MDIQTDRQAGRQADRQIDSAVDRKVYRWVDRSIGKSIGSLVRGYMDRWIDCSTSGIPGALQARALSWISQEPHAQVYGPVCFLRCASQPGKLAPHPKPCPMVGGKSCF